VTVPEFRRIERYSHVMHLVSAVKGELRDGVTAVEAFLSGFPAGTVSGAPKIRAMELIDELEPLRRNVYSGAVMYAGFSGNLDSCIAIRTFVLENGSGHDSGRRRDRLRLGARERARRDREQGRRLWRVRSAWPPVRSKRTPSGRQRPLMEVAR
jgi:anthranilate/para-aminobenzoate synthase component I